MGKSAYGLCVGDLRRTGGFFRQLFFDIEIVIADTRDELQLREKLLHARRARKIPHFVENGTLRQPRPQTCFNRCGTDIPTLHEVVDVDGHLEILAHVDGLREDVAVGGP